MKDYPIKSYNACRNSGEYLKNLIELQENIFHDCKNFLSIISGLSQISLIVSESEEVKKNLNAIYKASFQCKDTMEKFYYFIKGYDVSSRENVALSRIVLATLDIVNDKLSACACLKKIKLCFKPESSGEIYCNEYEIKQGIINVLLNGIDAMEGLGGVLEIDLYEKGDQIVLEISDSGIGIAEKDLDKIFLDSFTTKEHGSGLGLRISKKIFEVHGGSITAESEEGKGSKFIITLPKAGQANLVSE